MPFLSEAELEHTLLEENRHIHALLSRLISGTLRISNFDIFLERLS